MSGTKLMEEIDCANFFDQIDDLLEFPNDDVEKNLVDNGATIDQYNDFPPVFWSENSPVFSSAHSNTASDLSAQLSVPYEDIVQLEWLSTFVEDSFAGADLTVDKSQCTSSTKESPRNHFQISSPISVLESSSSCSRGNAVPVSHEKRKRARSKRRRPASFNPRAHPTSSSINETHYSLFTPYPYPYPLLFESENFVQKKKKKIKILPPSGGISKSQSQNQNENPNANTGSQAVRKCMHCEITKTPQWRAGPMGPKTLCNACGVRYKSGRLFPEYRPAASPTYIPTIHSNSHKKVLEMRTKPNDDFSCLQEPKLIPKTALPSPYM
ncbi:GATA transcription factor 8 [Spinacia oleracea]|uniref:GATA transcription factor n=1 Tax=Spinacia oleracea TaxID=3562 RepID=A0A9R0JA89_SPIOL|nr:GATA transcription factor 8-like [Spinacia oleracea]